MRNAIQAMLEDGPQAAARAAVVVALVLFGITPAWAGSPAFSLRDGLADPLAAVSAASAAAPALGDLDGDGDPDLVLGEAGGGFTYFENTGTASNPVFALAVSNPLGGEDVGGASAPVLGDLDGDGDLDLIAGDQSGGFSYFENTGTRTNPVFVFQPGSGNPLDGQALIGSSTPALGDLDGDGDLDLVAGKSPGNFTYYENTGSASSPVFTVQTGLANPLFGKDIGHYSSPALADFDGDGDLDLVSGESAQQVRYFENTGDASSPLFVLLPNGSLPLGAEGLIIGSNVAAADLDADGDIDFVAGDDAGAVWYVEHGGRGFLAREKLAPNLGLGDIGDRSKPVFADLDADGDLDVITGEGDNCGGGGFRYFENVGSASNPEYVFLPSQNPFGLGDVGSESAPALGDLDGDGDLDLLSGEQEGGFHYFRNDGTASSPVFVQAEGGIPFGLGDIGERSTPTLVDIDADGDLDVLSGEGNVDPFPWESICTYEGGGGFRFFENVGTPTSPSFVLVGGQNPLGLGDVGANSAPTLIDLDADFDLDLVSGRQSQNSSEGLAYFENVGDPSAPFFVERLGAQNPMDGQLANGRRFAPALGDLDSDGDADLVVGEDEGGFFYYENTGSGAQAVFVAGRVRGVYLAGLTNVGTYSAPSLGDLDGDGDFDLVAGLIDGMFQYFRNDGDALVPSFTLAANPLAGEDVGFEASPALADFDGDADLDLLSGETYGTLLYYENTGTGSSPAFALAATNPLGGEDVYAKSAPASGDIDGDGDIDLVSGDRRGGFSYFENTGTVTSPIFVPATGIANPLDGHQVLSGSTKPALGDLDGDGDLDLVSGETDGTLLYYENTGSGTSPVFTEQIGARNPLFGQDIGFLSTPALADLDGDGDLDLVSGEIDGDFFFFENSVVLPGRELVELVGAANPLYAASVGVAAGPTLADLDGDGDPDLLVAQNGPYAYFENTGSVTSPVFVERIGAANPMNGQNSGIALNRGTFGDLDGDGDLDLVNGAGNGLFNYYENTGNADAPTFVAQSGTGNPIDGFDVGNFATATLGDLDGDGDLDLVSGENAGTFYYFENQGDATSPVFVASTGSANPLDGEDIGDFSTPVLVDWDKDGDLDLVSGAFDGSLFYFENTGNATSAAFIAQTGTSNPFDGENAGIHAAPALADLYGSGSPDLVVGNQGGTLGTYLVPEPGMGAMLSSGLLLLLCALARSRGRTRPTSPRKGPFLPGGTLVVRNVVSGGAENAP